MYVTAYNNSLFRRTRCAAKDTRILMMILVPLVQLVIYSFSFKHIDQ